MLRPTAGRPRNDNPRRLPLPCTCRALCVHYSTATFLKPRTSILQVFPVPRPPSRPRSRRRSFVALCCAVLFGLALVIGIGLFGLALACLGVCVDLLRLAPVSPPSGLGLVAAVALLARPLPPVKSALTGERTTTTNHHAASPLLPILHLSGLQR